MFVGASFAPTDRKFRINCFGKRDSAALHPRPPPPPCFLSFCRRGPSLRGETRWLVCTPERVKAPLFVFLSPIFPIFFFFFLSLDCFVIEIFFSSSPGFEWRFRGLDSSGQSFSLISIFFPFFNQWLRSNRIEEIDSIEKFTSFDRKKKFSNYYL